MVTDGELLEFKQLAYDHDDLREGGITQDDLWTMISEIERLREFEALARETGIFKQ